MINPMNYVHYRGINLSHGQKESYVYMVDVERLEDDYTYEEEFCYEDLVSELKDYCTYECYDEDTDTVAFELLRILEDTGCIPSHILIPYYD